MTSQSSRTETGFSLIELVVAMAVTLVVTGAVYGLLAGGQNAFRREPELSDRQQNIRVAMDLIMRDIANAGSGLPTFMQTFTPGLNNTAGSPLRPDMSERADELEMITNDSGKDNEPVCTEPGTSGNPVLKRGTSVIPDGTVVLILMEDGTWTMRNVTSSSTPNTGSGGCDAGEEHVHLNHNNGAGDQTNMNPVPGSLGLCQPNNFGVGSATISPTCVPKEISFAELVHYRIRNNATDGVPELQRMSTGTVPMTWQILARGIEDMQIEYTQPGAPTWVAGAPAVIGNNYTSLINQVRVTLSARSASQRIAGATKMASGGVAGVRGELISTGSPRSTLINLANGPIASQQWR